eukprot:GAHX01003226.1.p1 GENE.GAHX01003226.1~~GAHX01003226.1.p1  ORF type:complete len:224 (+),score=37.18 GAHX01003226.1:99-674(+)
MEQQKFYVCKNESNTLSRLEQDYDRKLEIEVSNDENEKDMLQTSIVVDNIHETKLNTRRIINFLMADDLIGSIYLRKSYRFSTELATVDFWECFKTLDRKYTIKDEFHMDLKIEEFKTLFQPGVSMNTDNKVKVAWYLYNAGYINADKMYAKTIEDKEEKYVKLKWTNYQKRLSFIEEHTDYIINELYYRD